MILDNQLSLKPKKNHVPILQFLDKSSVTAGFLKFRNIVQESVSSLSVPQVTQF